MIASEAVVEMAVVGPLMVVDLRMEVVEDLQVEGDLRVEVVAGLLLLLLRQSKAVLGHL